MQVQERRERSRREAEEKRKKQVRGQLILLVGTAPNEPCCIPQADAEAKASELERQAKERVQDRTTY